MDNIRFETLSATERREALETATILCGRPPHLLEKDIWVVQTLSVLFEAPFGRDLVFKGGTSLAKAYRAIRRFSEDVDITYDIRSFAPELVAEVGGDALPPTRSQERRWTRLIRSRLTEWTGDEAVPAIRAGLARSGFPARLRADGDRIYVGYRPLFDDYGFVQPEVLVEFGARSTGEPRQERRIECDAAPSIPDVRFPAANPLVMLAERTSWEKATAIHVFCRRRRHRGERLSRHWHDLVRLDDAGYADRAFADRRLARSVARHKAIFFAEKDRAGCWIDYDSAVSGALTLRPEGLLYDTLANDYERMRRDGMLDDDTQRFDDVMSRCQDIERRANGG